MFGRAVLTIVGTLLVATGSGSAVGASPELPETTVSVSSTDTTTVDELPEAPTDETVPETPPVTDPQEVPDDDAGGGEDEAPTTTAVEGSIDTVTSDPADSTVDDDVDVDAERGESDDVGPLPGGSPQIRSSTIPVGSIVLALLVLGGVGAASYELTRRQRADRTATTRPLHPRSDGERAGDRVGASGVADPALLGFLVELGESLIDAGDAVNRVDSTLRTVARVNGVDDLGVLAMPTALLVSVPGEANLGTAVSTAGRTPLRLDQIDDVLQLVREAERGDVDVIEGTRRLESIRSSDAPYDPRLRVIGHVCATVGLALVLHATGREIVVAILLGALIGAFRSATRSLGSSYQPFIPLIAATAVSVSVFALARVVDDLVTFPLLVAPLVMFLPGALLTTGVLELATGQIVSGASRLASGAMQLVLLALGIVAGGQLVGIPTGDLRGDFDGPIAVIAPWAGVAIFGIGIVWFHGARASARGWILLVLYVAFAGQVIGGLFFGSGLSAFFGALAMTPVALFISRQPNGPTPLVMFLPGFWILVPGALGLEGVARLLGDDSGGGIAAVITTVTSMVGISLGILLGLIATTSDPEHPWNELHASE